MRGFQPAKPKGRPFANGGPVRGPGSGTSDEVPDEVPEGTYIMPADSTQAIGQQELAAMGGRPRGFAPGAEKVPVQLSNGEFKMPPEQVHAVGVQALDQIKDATHTPVAARGFAPGARDAEPPQFFANGGKVQGKRLHLMNAGVATKERLEEEGRVPQNQAITPPTKPNSFGDSAAMNTTPSVVRQPEPAWMSPSASAATPTRSPVNALADPAAASRTVDLAQQTKANAFGDAAAANSNPGISQPAAPARPAPAPQSATTPRLGEATSDYLNRGLGDAAQAWQEGNIAGAAGQATKTALGTVGMAGIEALDRTVGDAGRFAMDVGGRFVGGVLGTDTPGGQVKSPASSPAPQKQTSVGFSAGATKPSPTSFSGDATSPTSFRSTVGLRPPTSVGYDLKPDTSNAGADGAENAGTGQVNGFSPVDSLPGVYRKGNEYTDTPAGGTMARGLPPAVSVGNLNAIGGGGIGIGSADSLAAPQTRGLPMPQISHSANDWQARNDLRNAQVSANSDTNQYRARQLGRFSDGELRYRHLLAADTEARKAEAAIPAAAMRADTELQQEGMRQAGATRRQAMQTAGDIQRDGAKLGLEAQRQAFDQQVRGFEVRGNERQEKLYQRYEAAKTPEERAAVAQQIRDLSGKSSNPRDDLMVVGGGQEWDSKASVMRNVPQRVFDARTRQFVDGGQGQQASPHQEGQRLKRDGKEYVVRNGQAVPI